MLEKDRKVSVARCKEILNRGERKYTDEEVKKIRNYFYYLAEIAYDAHVRKLEKEQTEMINS